MVSEEGTLVLVDKPADLTSHDVVERVRRVSGVRRVGHTGTLDPFATGLLLLCVGSATRLVEYFHFLSKTYRATLRLGVETTTDDRTGAPGFRSDRWRGLDRARVTAALESRVGEGLQVPPAFSAKRIDGIRSYERARAGAAPDLDPVPVRVHALTLERFEGPEIELVASVSTGTYIRALARDLGRDLGCGAHLTELRRIRIGSFRVEEAATLTSLEEGTAPDTAYRTPYDALRWLPVRELESEEEAAVLHGRRIPAGDVTPSGLPEPCERPSEEVLPIALVRHRRLLAIAERRGGDLQPRKVLTWG